MKTIIPFLHESYESMLFALGSFTSGVSSLFINESLINKEFLNKFENKEDKDLLNSTVSELKTGSTKSKKITLSCDYL